jgi:hypothetical protein
MIKWFDRILVNWLWYNWEQEYADKAECFKFGKHCRRFLSVVLIVGKVFYNCSSSSTFYAREVVCRVINAAGLLWNKELLMKF